MTPYQLECEFRVQASPKLYRWLSNGKFKEIKFPGEHWVVQRARRSRLSRKPGRLVRTAVEHWGGGHLCHTPIVECPACHKHNAQFTDILHCFNCATVFVCASAKA